MVKFKIDYKIDGWPVVMVGCFGQKIMSKDRIVELLNKKVEWISVEDRLPEARKIVLAFMPDCRTQNVYFSGTSFHEAWGDEFLGSLQPKYWMPLPEPPKGA